VVSTQIEEHPDGAGFKPSVIGYRLAVVRYPLSVIGYRLSVVRYPLSVISYRLSVIGYRLSVIRRLRSGVESMIKSSEK